MCMYGWSVGQFAKVNKCQFHMVHITHKHTHARTHLMSRVNRFRVIYNGIIDYHDDVDQKISCDRTWKYLTVIK